MDKPVVDHQPPTITPGFEPSGQLIREFPVRNQKLNRWLRTGFGLAFILIAITALLMGFFNSWTAVIAYGRAALLQTLPLPLIGFLVGLPVGIILLCAANRHWQDGVALSENGLTVHRGKHEQFWGWDSIELFDSDIEQVKFATSVIAVNTQLTLEDNQGRRITLNDRYTDMPELVERLRQALLPRMYAKAVLLLSQGQSIPFHPDLHATIQGLEINAALIPWRQLELSARKNGLIQLHQCTTHEVVFSAKLKKIHNLTLLLALLENPPSATAYSSSPR